MLWELHARTVWLRKGMFPYGWPEAWTQSDTEEAHRAWHRYVAARRVAKVPKRLSSTPTLNSTALVVPGGNDVHKPQRRAVRLASPFFGWQSAGRGRRDALPYSDVNPVQGLQARITGSGNTLPKRQA